MSDVSKTETSGPSRRSVVRTAAHAAWAVPAIQIAAAAPAFAAASDDLTITAASATGGSGTTNRVFTLTATVRNDSPNDTLTGLTVTYTFAGTYGTLSLPTVPTGSLWAPNPVSGSTVSFTYSGSVLKGDSVSLTGATVTTQNKPEGNQVKTITAVASGANFDTSTPAFVVVP